jgi:hypothetical protein
MIGPSRPTLRDMSPSSAASSPDHYRQLTETLWEYRALLRRVEVLLEAQILFAGAGRDGHLAVVAELLEETSNSIGLVELHREVLLEPLAEQRQGEQWTPALSELAEVAGDTWGPIIADHHDNLTATVERIQLLIDQSRHTMGATLDRIAQMTNGISETPVTGYDRAGRTVRSSAPALLFDGQA